MRRNTAEEPATVSTARAMPVIALSLITIVSAVVGLNVALPDIARSTGASQTDLTWIIDAYTVAFAALLFPAGALGDRFGRKLLLVIGLAVFGAAAAVGGLVEDPTALIAVRAVMGAGASAVMPTTLSVITTSFPEEDRPKAIGAWVGMAGAGAILGLLATGTLLEFFAWNSFFWLNVGLSAVAIVGALLVIPNSVDRDAPRVDVVGALLALVAAGSLVFGIIEGPERGWGDALTVGALAVGAAAGAAFVAWEWRRRQPMLDPRLFGNRGLTLGVMVITVSFLCWFGLIFSVLQYLQFVVGESPLMAAVRMLPVAIFMLPTARLAPRLARRIGFRWTVGLGLALLATGFVLFSRVGVELDYAWFVLALAVTATGMGLSGTPSTTAVTESLPMAKQGVASALNDTAREFGAAFGIAVLGATLNEVYRSAMEAEVTGLPGQAADRILSSVAFTNAPELAMLGPRGQELADAGRQAFVDGIGTSMLVAAGFAAVASVIVLLFARRR